MAFVGHWYILLILIVLFALFAAALVGMIVAGNVISNRLINRRKD